MLPASQTSQLALWDAVNHKLSDQHAFDEISHPLESFQPKCACINIFTGSANTMRWALFCSELALTDVRTPDLVTQDEEQQCPVDQMVACHPAIQFHCVSSLWFS